MGSHLDLRELADYLGLAPAIVSIVLNDSPSAEPVPAETRRRIVAAARDLGYVAVPRLSPANSRRSFTIGIVVPELADGYFTLVMNGIEEHLLRAGYLHYIVSHQRRPDLLSEYELLLMKGNVDGLVLVNTTLSERIHVPAVSLSGHAKIDGVSNLMLDHDQAAHLALKHLHDLGHRRICFMKGQRHSGDSDFRWDSIVKKAKALGVTVDPALSVYLEANAWSPELGYPVIAELLRKTRDFTAVVCFNDFAAVGAIRALHDHGIRCPKDVSVIGFDDIAGARFNIPSVTTIRQPLRRMGELAAQILVNRIENPDEPYSDTLILQPELVVRESTGPARSCVPARTGVETVQ